ncbi:IPT/TIG domain-containing protein [Gracilimonas sp.]|uniref:IPT/TIG domain-containing protein n=1 Tax=Gracilimonas sp. TaxID=1974203 RepID=UPI0032EEB825
MKFRKINHIVLLVVLTTGLISCKEGNSVYDPDYEPSRPNPVVTNITPVDGYLAGVDSVIVTGENFATDPDSVTINFGGSAGVVKSATKTQLVVRPGTIWGDDLNVRVSVRGAEFFSDSYLYDLIQPFGLYPGVASSNNPNTPVAVDAQNNVYAIINTNGIIRYTRISPDGTVTTDNTRYQGELDDDDNPYPSDSTMRFNSYSALAVGPNGDLFLAQQSLRAVFVKTFGNDLQEDVWAASTTNALKIRDMVFDNNGFLWVVGVDSDQIHRFNVTNRAESKTNFAGAFSSVAFYAANNELYVGGEIQGGQKVWKFTIDGGGNLTQGGLYFDYSQHYGGSISDMILASNGELIITTGREIDDVSKPSMVRVYPDGRHEAFYEGMLKPGITSITWRDDEFAVVTVRGDDENSINFLNMYDRTRAGIFGF